MPKAFRMVRMNLMEGLEMKRRMLVALVLGLLAALPGCPGDVNKYYSNPSGSPDPFPGTPVSALNLAEDAKALSPGGQDVLAVKVFWNGHDTHEAVVLFETRIWLGTDSSNPLYDRIIYYHHLWASRFNGSTLSKPVELLGKDASYMQVIMPDRPPANGGPVEWRNLTDTAYALFYRSSTTGKFGAAPSSAAAAARQGDAVIFFRRADVDTLQGSTPGGVVKDNSNERLYCSYFDASQAGVPWALTQDAVGTGAASARVFRYGFMEEAIPVNSDETYDGDQATGNDVRTFGVLSDGFLGRAWWSRNEIDADPVPTFTHFLAAVWTEIVVREVDERGVFNRYVPSLPTGLEIDVKLMASYMNLETGLFSAPVEIEPDTTAAESTAGSGYASEGDSVVNDDFITYDNQVFFTYVDAAIDNDPGSVSNNYDFNDGDEAIDSVLGWNIFKPTLNGTAGAGAFLANSIELSPQNAVNYRGVDVDGTTCDIPDLVSESAFGLKNENEQVVFGADEGLAATYIFFLHARALMDQPAQGLLDDADLFVAQIRHDDAGGAYFTPAQDRMEVDTLDDTMTAVNGAGPVGTPMDFTTNATTHPDEVWIGTTGGGPPFDNTGSSDWRLISIGGEERLADVRSGVGANAPAYITHNGSSSVYYDRDFTTSVTDQDVTFEAIHRGVQQDWRVVLNKSSEFFMVFFRQQDATNQSFGLYGGAVRYTAGDVGLYASRITATPAGQAPAALAGLVGDDAERLDTDTSTTDPTAASQFRNDVVAFNVQGETGSPFIIQSDLDSVGVVWLTIDDDNPASNDARNTYTTSSTHSFDVVRAARVLNGTTALTVQPAGGAQIGTFPFGWMTDGNDGTGVDSDGPFKNFTMLDAGVNGDCVIYYTRPEAPDVLEGSPNPVYRPDSPADVRLFAANFNGTTTVTTQRISTQALPGEKEVVFAPMPMTRGVSPSSASGRAHLILFIEARGSGGTSGASGGAMRALKYTKAVPENGDTSAVLVSSAGAFLPSPLTTDPFMVDFDSGDSISFPAGFGAKGTDIAVYFTQFGEVWYNRYVDSSGSFYKNDYGQPAPLLVSNDGYPGMPSFYTMALSGESDFFGILADGNYMLSTFTSTIDGKVVTSRSMDNMDKALIFWGKDDGGCDPEGDGTGFHRLLARIHE